MSFVRWLRGQVDRDDDIGWLARDFTACINCGCFKSDRGEFSEVAAHIRLHYQDMLKEYEDQVKALVDAEMEYDGNNNVNG